MLCKWTWKSSSTWYCIELCEWMDMGMTSITGYKYIVLAAPWHLLSAGPEGGQTGRPFQALNPNGPPVYVR